MLGDLKRARARRHLTDPAYGFLFDTDDSGDVIALAITASSFDAAEARLTGFAAIPVQGNRIATSQALVRHFADDDDAAVDAALPSLLRLFGGRPLVGYFIDFGVAVLDRRIRPQLGIGLPNPQIDVSALYYDRKSRLTTKAAVDLRFDSILHDLSLPGRAPADAVIADPAAPAESAPPSPRSDAIAAALIYLKLTTAPSA